MKFFSSSLEAFHWGDSRAASKASHVVKPEFRHAIVIRSAFVTGDAQTVALHQLAESRDSSADGAVDIFPVTKEFIVRQAHPLADAINEFEHNPLSRAISFPLIPKQSSQQHPPGLPRIASRPSRTINGATTRAATGSAHRTCQIALTPRPTRAISER